MATTREEFAQFRGSQSYRDLFASVAENVQTAAAEIINRRDVDIPRDQWLRGFIFALSEVAAFVPEWQEDEEVEDEEA